MARPKAAVLTVRFSIAPFGGNVAQLADIDGDGALELLVLQGPGQFKSRIYGDRTDIDDVDRQLYCLTAFTLEGDVIWQDGTPYDREVPFTGHGGRMFLVDDIDADGRPEMVVIRRDELAILDATTGREIAITSLPADNYANLYTAQLGPPGSGRHILCRVNDRAYEPWEYANPTIVYNPDLSIYREPFAVRGAGHNMIAQDIDGDGRDELFIGYSLFDHHCNEIWSLDLGPGSNYAHDHADEIALADLDGDGALEVRYAGSEDFFVADLDGNLLWQTRAGHSQNSIQGAWGPNGETRLIMCEKWRGIWGLDTEGNILWHRTDINGYVKADVHWARGGVPSSWGLFQPQLKPFPRTPYKSDPSWSRGLWPRFIDGDGTLYDVLPWDEAYAQPAQLIRARRCYDCGVTYATTALDMDGDGLDEIVVHDRRHVWVFHSPT